MRGDDRPGMKKAEPQPAGRGGKFGDRKGSAGGKFGERRDDRGPRDSRGEGRFGGDRFGDRAVEDRGPRLGDVAFRAQREALEHAQTTLKKLAAQAHGEALTQLMTAWEHRAPDQLPSPQELGKSVHVGGSRRLGAGAGRCARRATPPRRCCVLRSPPRCRRRPSN